MDKTSQESASFERDSSTPQVDLRALAMRIKRTVRRETNGGVQDLNVRIDPGGIFLQGRCNSFYCKQLAQTAAMRLGGGASVINEIEVAASNGDGNGAPALIGIDWRCRPPPRDPKPRDGRVEPSQFHPASPAFPGFPGLHHPATSSIGSHRMNDYQPTSRRPIADLFRRTADGAVHFCVRWRIHPDAVSYGSVVASALAGVCFWLSGRWAVLLIPAALFCYVRLWLNMLDGMVAIAAQKASLRGELLNDLPDRLSDAIIFAGVAQSGLCYPASGYWAAIFALLTAYVGTFGQAVGVGRQFGGIMSKPWRMVTLHIGSWIALGLLWGGKSIELGPLSVLDWTNLLVIAGCTQTIAVRLKRILRGLAARGG